MIDVILSKRNVTFPRGAGQIPSDSILTSEARFAAAPEDGFAKLVSMISVPALEQDESGSSDDPFVDAGVPNDGVLLAIGAGPESILFMTFDPLHTIGRFSGLLPSVGDP